MRTIDWTGDAITIIDQTALPGAFRTLRIETVEDLIGAIRRLAIRGAPALGAAGALGVALAALNSPGDDEVRSAAEALCAARPTAVNLAWGIERALAHLAEGVGGVVAEAVRILDEDGANNRRIGRRGAEVLSALGLETISALTHCNAGALACVEWGTALGVIRQLHDDDRLKYVIATETRPLLQGARLTAHELADIGVEFDLVVDSAAAYVLANHLVDVVIVGADRIAANGDTANKIGTFPIALAAAYSGVPFMVAAPESTIDPRTAEGTAMTIELRDEWEVTSWSGTCVAPPGTHALNPAFDVTPANLITAIVTESRVIRPQEGERPFPAAIGAYDHLQKMLIAPAPAG